MDRKKDGEAPLPQSKHLTKHGERRLTPRELQIVRLLAAGRSNKQVAFILAISVKTVEAHRSRIMLKLKLDSLVGLVHYAIRQGIVQA